MKRKSTDRKYGKEFFLFLAIMMLTFGVVLSGQNFFTTEIYTNQNEAGICRGGIVPFSIFCCCGRLYDLFSASKCRDHSTCASVCWIFICRVLFFRDHAVCIGRTAHAALLYEKGRYSSAGGNRGADGCCDSL